MIAAWSAIRATGESTKEKRSVRVNDDTVGKGSIPVNGDWDRRSVGRIGCQQMELTALETSRVSDYPKLYNWTRSQDKDIDELPGALLPI